MLLENDYFRVKIDESTGAIVSWVAQEAKCDLIGEKRLAANFRLCMPLEGFQCNYIEGTEQRPSQLSRAGDAVTVHFSNLFSPQGTFRIDLTCIIELVCNEIRFRAKLVNHEPHAISEFWFPRLGGWTQFGKDRNAKAAVPGYLRCAHTEALFRELPRGQGLGAEAAEWSVDYPGMMMPWIDIYDHDTDAGLYLGYHDQVFRYSTWHTYLYPTTSGRQDEWLKKDEAGELPVGLVFSHVRYPFIAGGETFESGEFIIRAHKGDWHKGSLFYRDWFLRHFPFDNSGSWLRKKRSWFSSVIYQPEDRIVTDYEGYDKWCEEAKNNGIDTYELIGWDKGGLERDYPEYVPEEKLGGKQGFRKLLRNIDSRGGKCLVFVNYNILDQNTEWFRNELYRYQQQDQFGKQSILMGWGESTLLARKGLNVRRHLVASVVPSFESLLEKYLLELVEDGAHGFQIDKLCMGSKLDFNPLNKMKPDVALCEGLVQAIRRLSEKCRAINPDFCFAAEAIQDRLLPYVDVFYRNSHGTDISPLRYVFPEWTSCQHISAPKDFRAVNGAVLTGSVICVEPFSYQGSIGHPLYQELGRYIQEIDRIREKLSDIIFLGRYYDTCGATIIEMVKGNAEVAAETEIRGKVMIPEGGTKPGSALNKGLAYRVHGHNRTDQRAIVIANTTNHPIEYKWQFTHRDVLKADLYVPFHPEHTVLREEPITIDKETLHILLERSGA